jgi:hypothetical protein
MRVAKVGQEKHTNVCLGSVPALTFGQIIEALMALYGVSDAEKGRFVARVYKIQRAGVPIGANVGKGPRVSYSLDQFFQLLVTLELAELSISLTNASRMVRDQWPESGVSLAPAQAWLAIRDGDANSVLLLASGSGLEGFAQHPNPEAAEMAAAGRFVMGKPSRATDGLGTVAADRLIRDGRFDLSATSLTTNIWRTSIVDMTTLVQFVVRVLVAKQLVSENEFTTWAIAQCDAFTREQMEV